MEYATVGIGVNTVAPGVVSTAIRLMFSPYYLPPRFLPPHRGDGVSSGGKPISK
jgi:hypothetical protein